MLSPISRRPARPFRVILLASSVALVGCTASPSAPSRDATPAKPAPDVAAKPAPPMRQQTASGRYYVTCTPLIPSIPVNQLFTLQVRVYRDADLQQPASNVAISADADMPAHRHGMTLMPRVRPIPDSPGAFEVTGMLFHMPGAWEIYIDVREDAQTDRAIFQVEI